MEDTSCLFALQKTKNIDLWKEFARYNVREEARNVKKVPEIDYTELSS